MAQAYAWTQDWECPECRHFHSKPHFAFKDQVDLTKLPNQEGRVIYAREQKHDVCSDTTGPVEINGKQQGLFCPHCFDPNTLIYAIDGLKKISEIQVGDKVLDKDGQFTRVTKVFEREYIGEVYDVKPLGSRSIRMTPEHPVFVISEMSLHSLYNKLKTIVLKQASELKVNDFLIFPKTRTEQEQECVKYWLIPYGKANLKNIISKGRSVKNGLKYIPITESLCRLWGYYLSEGYTHGDREISFAFHRKETEFIVDIQQMLHELFGIGTVLKYNKDSQVCIVNACSSGLARALKKDFGFLAEGKKLPHWVFSLPRNMQRQIFIGWFRGDGCKFTTNDGGYTTYQAKTISSQLTYGMKLLLANFNCSPAIHLEKAHGIHKDAYTLILSKQFIDLSLKTRKTYLRYITSKDHIYIPIRKIERHHDYQGNVYNLETESHTYTTSGFAVHNCGFIHELLHIEKIGVKKKVTTE